MLTLHIANKNYSSWSLRPWVLMSALDLPFQELLHPFGQGVPFQSFSPTGQVPCLVDDAPPGGGGPVVVWDSLAITEYLAERHAEVWPADARARAWARCAAAEMHAGFSALRNTCTMNCGLRIALRQWPAEVLAQWARIEALWQDGLQRFGGPWLAGERFTAVDAFFAPVAFRIQTYSPPIGPIATAYAQRLRDLPALQDWYAAGLAETWRDEAHEAEARAAGDWLQDLRRVA